MGFFLDLKQGFQIMARSTANVQLNLVFGGTAAKETRNTILDRDVDQSRFVFHGVKIKGNVYV